MNPIRFAAATLAAGLVAGLGSTAAFAGSIDDALASFHHQPIIWHQCQLGPDDADGEFLDQFGAQCADITVPLDYNRPTGRTITLALSRLAASDQTHRIGALVFNLGGPSIPALPRVVDARFGMGDTGARFDLIGLDPRFVGRSTPLDCGWPTSWQPRSPGLDRAGFDRTVALTRDLAQRCADRQGDLLRYASTANIARDMDVVRAALGEPKLSFLGYSYGSYIGALYTQLFPGSCSARRARPDVHMPARARHRYPVIQGMDQPGDPEPGSRTEHHPSRIGFRRAAADLFHMLFAERDNGQRLRLEIIEHHQSPEPDRRTSASASRPTGSW